MCSKFTSRGLPSGGGSALLCAKQAPAGHQPWPGRRAPQTWTQPSPDTSRLGALGEARLPLHISNRLLPSSRNQLVSCGVGRPCSPAERTRSSWPCSRPAWLPRWDAPSREPVSFLTGTDQPALPEAPHSQGVPFSSLFADGLLFNFIKCFSASMEMIAWCIFISLLVPCIPLI